MPSMARRDLPVAIRKSVARAKAKKAQIRREVIPAWQDDDEHTARVLNVYRMYLAHYSIKEISAANGCISGATIYRYIDQARDETSRHFQKDLDNIVRESIMARQIIISEARDSLAELRRDGDTLDRESEDLGRPNQGAHFKRQWIAPTDRAAIARAEAALMAVISANQTAIEEIVSLRQRGGGISESLAIWLAKAGYIVNDAGGTSSGELMPDGDMLPALVIDVRTN